MNSTDFTLLYIEDDSDLQEWFYMLFERKFEKIYQAFNGEEGYDYYKKYNPDIIITDINIPLLDGLNMAQKIKLSNKNQPIIAISAFDDKETLLKAINIGINYFVQKPVNINFLNEKIDEIISNLSNLKEIENLRQKKIDHLYQLAHYDTLTGIQNRFFFEKSLQEMIHRAKKMNFEIVLFFIDLDDFKRINDTYGHAVGDTVLQKVVENIQNIIRQDDVFARISGDEFALVLEVINSNFNIDLIANKIITTLQKDIKIENKSMEMSCSIGISHFPQDATSEIELLKKADIAMYSAKETGKSSFKYYKDIK